MGAEALEHGVPAEALPLSTVRTQLLHMRHATEDAWPELARVVESTIHDIRATWVAPEASA